MEAKAITGREKVPYVWAWCIFSKTEQCVLVCGFRGQRGVARLVTYEAHQIKQLYTGSTFLQYLRSPLDSVGVEVLKECEVDIGALSDATCKHAARTRQVSSRDGLRTDGLSQKAARNGS